MRRALIVYKDIFPHDAVGHDAIEEARCLRRAGWEVSLYAESAHGSIRDWMCKEPGARLADRSELLIYHQAVFWEKGIELLTSARCIRVVKYHNITPAHFFLPYSPADYRDCFLARDQNRRLARAGLDMVICDSSYNAREFALYGLPSGRLRVSAPFNRTERLAHTPPSPAVLKRLGDGKLNVFFVGRICPNKGLADIMRTAQTYRLMFGDDARFVIAGGLDPTLSGYYRDLQILAAQLGVSDLVEFVGQVSDTELRAYLAASHIFLLLSEHEGFCLPIIEAQAFGLPIVARDCTAIGEVIGADQLVFEKDVAFEVLACAIRTLHERPEMRRYLAAHGRRNAAEYSADRVGCHFLRCVEEAARR